MEVQFIPDFILRVFLTKNDRRISHNILISNAILLILILCMQHIIVYLVHLPSFCIFQKILRIPCPGCGIIRSFIAISRLDVVSSLRFNPGGFLITSFAVVQIIMRLFVFLKEDALDQITIYSKLMNNLVYLALMTTWIIQLNSLLIGRR